MNAIAKFFTPTAALSGFQWHEDDQDRWATATITMEQTFQNFFNGCLNRITLNLRHDSQGFDVEDTHIEFFNLPINEYGQRDSDDTLTKEQLERLYSMPVIAGLIEEFKELVGE